MADIIPSQDTIYQSIRTVLATARQKAYTAINSSMVEAYWDIGRQIMEAQESQRAEYGTGLIKYLAERLTKEFGKGFTETNLKYMRQFYAAFPIRHALRDQLSWTHYRLLMKVGNEVEREFYLNECIECNWSSRQLERQITTFYYKRLLATRKEGKESVKNEIQETEPKTDPDFILKDPYILEFLDLKENKDYHESELEQADADNISFDDHTSDNEETDGKKRLSQKEQGAILREIVNTVGQRGKLGEKIRNVISVGMLTEGWDAKTVTHIMGLRAFSSKLLCEQVIGRGLRRSLEEWIETVNSIKDYGQWCSDISFNVADVDGIIEKWMVG